MAAPALLLLALAATAPAPRPPAAGEPRWTVGPAEVALAGGRVRCRLPRGVALAEGASARGVLAVASGALDGSEVAVLSPVAASETWFVVVEWRREERPPGDGAGGVGERTAALRWIERPRVDPRTGRASWAVAGAARGGPVVNQHVAIPSEGGALVLTLVTPVAELSAARTQLGRIVEGLRVAPPREEPPGLGAPAGARAAALSR